MMWHECNSRMCKTTANLKKEMRKEPHIFILMFCLQIWKMSLWELSTTMYIYVFSNMDKSSQPSLKKYMGGVGDW